MIPMVTALLAASVGTAAGAGIPLVGPGFTPALVLTGDARDSVAFEADSLIETPVEILISLHGDARPHRRNTRSLFFRVRTPGRIAVFVDSIGAPAWTAESARRALLERHATAPAWPHPLATSLDAFEYPRDWYRRAVLEVVNGFTTPVRVTWIAFDSPDEREIARVAALQSVGLHATLQSGAPQPPIERPQPPTEEALRLTVRTVGAVTVDPRSGRVQR